jgi:hypothetical protein
VEAGIISELQLLFSQVNSDFENERDRGAPNNVSLSLSLNRRHELGRAANSEADRLSTHELYVDLPKAVNRAGRRAAAGLAWTAARQRWLA